MRIRLHKSDREGIMPPMDPAPSPRQVDSWQAAEANASEWMRHWGFIDARVTKAGSDGGVDVRASRALAQVKNEASQVGRPAVQRLFGARGHDHGKALLFFTGAGYSRQAIECAETLKVALFKYKLDGAMTPVNGHARDICSAAGDSRSIASSRAESDRRPAADNDKRWPTFSWVLITAVFTMVFVDSADEESLGGLAFLGVLAGIAWALMIGCVVHNGSRKRRAKGG